MLHALLGWTLREMVDAYVHKQVALGATYQRVDPIPLGTRSGSCTMCGPLPIRMDVPIYAAGVVELVNTHQ
ncbi:hypothetical protein GGX14DRAFT_568391 [Mycena pura]|uniref:Uncharacterized protein n=1 Tax=Mycena pura TaxID=153505 RepID=A0AAD6V9P6_9AGAR|nr:hypothetical protein GGX14DRAFT_568391 [Mycena pura]